MDSFEVKDAIKISNSNINVLNSHTSMLKPSFIAKNCKEKAFQYVHVFDSLMYELQSLHIQQQTVDNINHKINGVEK